MRKVFLAIVFAALVMCSSCDSFRKLAGRPTSAEIEAKRAAIEAAAARAHQARLDSLEKVKKQMADSLAMLDSLKKMKGTALRGPAAMGGIVTEGLLKKYYIVVGAFMDKGNALAMKETISKAGYMVELIEFCNGYTAVGLCPSDSPSEIYRSLKRVKGEKFCPDGVWILVN